MLSGLDYFPRGYERMLEGKVKNNKGLNEMDRIWSLADHQGELFLRRVRNACTVAGVPFRYLFVTSDMDGKTGETARVHHHIIVNIEALRSAKQNRA